MPFYRPTLDEIRKRIESDFAYEMGSQAARIPGTIEYGLREALAGASHGLHGRLAQVAKDAFPHSAEDVEMQKWAAYYNVFRNPALPSAGVLTFFGTNGSEIPIGTRAVRADKREYKTIELGTIEAGSAQVNAVAVLPSLTGDHGAGTELTLKDPVEGIESGVTSGTFSGGADLELYRDLRRRLLERLANPPSGGGPGDYVAWAKEVTGVTRAWQFGKVPALGYVTLLFMRDLDEDGPFPDGPECDAVLAKLKEHAPVALPDPIVIATLEKELNLEIKLLVEDGAVEADVKDAIVASIQDMIAVLAEPSATVSVFYRSWISKAISTTPGVKDHVLVDPPDNVALAQWELVTLADDAVTWSAYP
ncbi:MAG: baseplate J/gp47 family protein [Myxococcales bacterium]|nr:baseplate J/gp47 family protein [Myxococcales bacterium]